jgi:integrase
MNDTAREPGTGLTIDQLELEAMADFASAARAPATLSAYSDDWGDFVLWCLQRGVQALPAAPETVARHLAACARGWRPPSRRPASDRDKVRTLRQLSPASLSRLVAAINYKHRAAGLESPTSDPQVKAQLAGIRRRYTGTSKKKAAADTSVMLELLKTCGDDLQGLRDRALLAVAFGAALRRSELVALNVEDITFVAQGMTLTVRRSKTDQLGEGVTVPVGHGSRIMPVTALQDWIAAAGITTGAIFLQVHVSDYVLPKRLTAGMVGLIVKRRARLAGLDADVLGAHSLRAGFITSAAERGANLFKIMTVSRHVSMDVMRGYVRSREQWRDYAGDGIL